jgi:hypothetical protein
LYATDERINMNHSWNGRILTRETPKNHVEMFCQSHILFTINSTLNWPGIEPRAENVTCSEVYIIRKILFIFYGFEHDQNKIFCFHRIVKTKRILMELD